MPLMGKSGVKEICFDCLTIDPGTTASGEPYANLAGYIEQPDRASRRNFDQEVAQLPKLFLCSTHRNQRNRVGDVLHGCDGPEEWVPIADVKRRLQNQDQRGTIELPGGSRVTFY